MAKKKVYISSTFKDLKEYRACFIDGFETILSKNFELSRIMERMYDTGNSKPNIDVCIEEVKESDIYFFILGESIGSYVKDEKDGITYTELEYDTAMNFASEKKIFRLIKEIKEEDIPEKDRIKYKSLKSKVKGNGLPLSTFSDIKDLKARFLSFMCAVMDDSIDFESESCNRFETIWGSIIFISGCITAILSFFFLEEKQVSPLFQIGVSLLFILLTMCIIGFLLRDCLSKTFTKK